MQNIDIDSNTNDSVPYPNIPAILESKETDYFSSGITSSVSIAGHPIHPILVIFPVAFLSGAAGSDLGYWLTADFFWARVSVWLIGLGGLAGILAALVGMFDFIKVKKVRRRTAGWAHMLINVTALILTFVNLGLRLDNPEATIVPIGISLSLVVATLLAVGGWYGGELSFRHKIGVIGSDRAS
jgi:uncharacterized membrane protein